MDHLLEIVSGLKQSVNQKENLIASVTEELEMMRTTIEEFLSLNSLLLSGSQPSPDLELEEEHRKDGLAFHGIFIDSMEKSSKTQDLKRNFLEHNVRRLLKKEWNIESRVKFGNITRYEKGPQLNGLDPIVVTFNNISDKEFLWMKIRENKTRSKVVVTQFDSNNIVPESIKAQSKERQAVRSRSLSPVKANTTKVRTESNLQPRPSRAEKAPADKPNRKTRSQSRRLNKKDKSADPSLQDQPADGDGDVYGDLDGSKSLLLHGLPSDFIEEEMSEDRDFRKEVLEQKVTTILSSVNFKRKIRFKFLSRWEEGPALADLQPVVLEFHEKKDKLEVYNCLREGLEKSGCVITEDSRSRLAGNVPNSVSNKLDFQSFKQHYNSYNVAQALFNKMIKIL